MRNLMRPVCLLAGMATTVLGQHAGWDEGQVNSTICSWRLPRVILVRDTIYMDGGHIMWMQGMETGEYKRTMDLNPTGVMLALNLSKPFSLGDNQTALFDEIPKDPGAASNSIVPNYVDGDLLGNDQQFFMYGGLTRSTDFAPDPDPDEVLQYQAYPPDSDDDAEGFSPGYVEGKLSGDVTRYLAFGAGVSAPSENKAWYFSGLKSNTSGVIYDGYVPAHGVPVNTSDTLITVTFDKAAPGAQASWENTTLPEAVRGRASPSGVFLPVGANGVLVFVGGVTHPEFASKTHESENPAALLSESPEFMSVIDVYDIASGTWYQQTAQAPGDLPVVAQGCAVAAVAGDRSSFNIYYYGGYTAEDQMKPFSDDVWILSVPSFRWIKAREGEEVHGRAGHRCVTPYPDQMMVLGGWTPKVGFGPDCLVGGIVQILNLTSLEWMEDYSPDEFGEYGVPEVVYKEIGGDAGGGAKEDKPAAGDGWDDEDLAEVFDTPYPTERITTWYPYTLVKPSERPTVGGGGEEEEDGSGKSGLPGWAPPLIGALLGVAFVVLVGVAVVIWRKRRLIKAASPHRNSIK